MCALLCAAGTYGVEYTPVAKGHVFIHVYIQVTPIDGSPFKCTVIDDDGENGTIVADDVSENA